MICKSSSVSLPHFSLIFPDACFHFPSIWSQFMETSCSVQAQRITQERKEGIGRTIECALELNDVGYPTELRPSMASGFDDVIANRVTHKFAHRVAVQTTHNIGPMRFCRFHTQTELCGNFLTALALRKQLHDLTLTGGEARFWRLGLRFLLFRRLVQIAIQYHLRDFSGKKRLVAAHCIHRSHQIAARIGLEHISASSRV